MYNFLYDNEFNLYVDEIWFLNERMGVEFFFEKEVKDNLGMVFWLLVYRV